MKLIKLTILFSLLYINLILASPDGNVQINNSKGKSLNGLFVSLLTNNNPDFTNGIIAFDADNGRFIAVNNENNVTELFQASLIDRVISIANCNNGLLFTRGGSFSQRGVYFVDNNGVKTIKAGAFDGPCGLRIAPSTFGNYGGDIFVGEHGNDDVIWSDVGTVGVTKIDSDGNMSLFYDGENSQLKLYNINDLEFAPDNFGNYGGKMLTLDQSVYSSIDLHRILSIDSDKNASVFFDLSVLPSYDYAKSMEFNHKGELFLATNNAIYKIDSQGNYEVVDTSGEGYIAIAFDSNDNLWAYDIADSTLKEIGGTKDNLPPCDTFIKVNNTKVGSSELQNLLNNDGITSQFEGDYKYAYKITVNGGGGYYTHTDLAVCLNGVKPLDGFVKGVSDDTDSEDRTQIGIYGVDTLSFCSQGWVDASGYIESPKLIMTLDSKWGSDIDTYIYFWFVTNEPIDTLGYVLLDNYNDDFGSITIDGYNLSGQTNSDLVAYYPFNGNANDESENNNNGTVNGATLTTDRFGNVNSAYSFDGQNDYIALPTQQNLFGLEKNLSISLWFKMDSTQHDMQLFSLEPSTSSVNDRNAGVMLAFDYSDWGSGKLDFFIGDGVHDGYSPSTYLTYSHIFDNSWHHVVVTRNDNIARIYVDDQLAAENTNFHNNNINWDGHAYEQDNYTIGAWQSFNGVQRFFNGEIDDIRVYDKALSSTEVDSLYHENGWSGQSELPPCDTFMDVNHTTVSSSELQNLLNNDGITSQFEGDYKYAYKITVNGGGGYYTHTDLAVCLNGVKPLDGFVKGVSDDTDSEDRTQIGIYGVDTLSFCSQGWVDASGYIESPKLIMTLDSKWGSDIDTYIYFWFVTNEPIDTLGYVLLDNYNDDFGSITIDGYNLSGTGIGENFASAPNNFILYQNFPNPFNPTTQLKYGVPTESRVTIAVYNVLGQKVAELFNGNKQAGYYQVTWDAANNPSGIYLVKFSAESINGKNAFTDVKKILLLK